MNLIQLDEEAIFHVARRIASHEARGDYLDQVCGDDRGLRDRLDALLRLYDQEASFLESPALGPPATVTAAGPPHPPEGPGAAIGPYKLLEPIGEGGMGTVFMAEQSRPVRRKVALKLIKPGMDTKQVIARFEAERQALALMDHPNIARVLDAGATESGLPYFVMELVRGLPITEYCDRESLPIPDRLELFVLVCRAVQHAHQKGVIHRDLKPSNILVTVVDGVPVPKVIDFGIAKATGASLTGGTLFTGFHQMVGTPLYMSPEQADLSSADVNTRSDIYSLGVLLYELLTGGTPFDREAFGKGGFDEMRRIIREDEPPRPSTRLSSLGETLTTVSARRGSDPRHLSRAVRGELDWIVMRALEKDRRRRYETANDFAADVMRHLTDRPVEACPPSARYRFLKYTRRHRAALTTAALVGLALAAGTAVSTWQALRATAAASRTRDERDRVIKAMAQTRTEAEKAKAINDFLTADLLEQAEPAHNAAENHVTLLEVLDRAAGRVGNRFREKPEVEVALRISIAQTYHGLGSWEKCERQWRAVRELARRPGADPAELYRAESGLSHLLKHRGRVNEEMLGMARSAAEGLARVLGPDHPATLTSRGNLASAYRAAGRTAEAIRMLEETLKLEESKLGPVHPDTLTSRHNLASAYRAAGRTAEAIRMHEEVLKLDESRFGPDHPHTLSSRGNLASAYLAAGRTAEAIRVGEEVLKLRESRLGPDHPDTLDSRGNLARAYLAAGRTAEAIRMHEEVLKLKESKLGPDHPATLTSRGNLAIAYRAAGRTAEAIRVGEEVLKLRESRLGPDHPDTLDSRSNLASAYRDAGRTTEAIRMLEETLRLKVSRLGPDHPDTLRERANLAAAYWTAGRTAEAIRVGEEVLKLCESRLGPVHPDTLTIRTNLAAAYRDAGRATEAIRVGEETLRLSESELGPGDLVTLYSRGNLAKDYLDVGRTAEATRMFEETLKLHESRLGPVHRVTLISRGNLANAYLAGGRTAEAIRVGEEVLKLRESRLGTDHSDTLASRHNLARAYLAAGRTTEATRMFEETLKLRESRQGPDHPATFLSRGNLAEAYESLGRWAEAELLRRDNLARRRKSGLPESPLLASDLAGLGRNLLSQARWSEAEPVLREGLAIREKASPDDWSRFHTMSLLGGALLGQGRYAEAEPLVVSGYEGMKAREANIPAPAKPLLAEAAVRVVGLYEGRGKPGQAAAWKAKLGLADLPADVFARPDAR